MKNKLSLLAYLLICSLVIGGAIYAGQKNHDHCRECKLAIGITEANSKFVSK